MSEVTGGSVPGSDGATGAGAAPDPETPATGAPDSTARAAQASGEAGLAPGPAADATPAEGIAPPPPSEFVFGGRRFASQAQAEAFFRSQVGRVPDMQRKTAEQERQLAELQQTVAALQRALSVGPQAAGPGQGPVRGAETPVGPAPFMDRFVKDELPFLMSCLQDPDRGAEKFAYSLGDIMNREIEAAKQEIIEKHVQPIIHRSHAERVMGHAMGVFEGLGADFPEFQRQNQSPEAVVAQQAFASTLKDNVPPEEIARNPEFYALAAALITRHQYGIPITATTPGTSGSPSDRAALAAEQALGTPGPIDGSSARPRPTAAQPRTPEEQFEADIIGADDKLARNLEGKPLGWRRVS